MYGSRSMIRKCLAGFLLGLLLGAALSSLLPKVAEAVPCRGTYNIAWTQGSNGHRGVKSASLAVFDHNHPDNAPNGGANVACDRVASLIVYNDTGAQMEIGWQIVPNNDQKCHIDTTHPQLPYLMVLATLVNGMQNCLSGPPVAIDTSIRHSMRAVNPNLDGHWTFYLDGSPVGTGTTSWHAGNVVADTEQHVPLADSAYEDFDGLKYITGTGEQPWDFAQVWLDCSSYYDGGKIGGVDDHIRMSQPGPYVSPSCL